MPTAEAPIAPLVFPFDALPPVAATYVTELGETGLPVDFVGMSALGVLAGAVGGLVTLEITASWSERSIVWLTIVGDPGSMKSPAIATVRGPLDRFQTDLTEAYRESQALYEQLPAKVRKTTPPPMAKRVLVGDVTMEALVRTLSENPAGVVLISDELRALIGGLGQYKAKGAAADRARLLELWAGLPVYVSRVKDGHIAVPNPTLSVMGGIQPDLLDTLSGPDGLRDRFLISYPDPGEPLMLSGRPERDEQPLIRARRQWEVMVSKLTSLRERERCVTLGPEAKELFFKMHDALRKLQRDPDQPDGIAGWAAKAPEHLARLAAVLAAAEMADDADHVIGVEPLRKAWSLIQYFYKMRRRLPSAEPNLMLAPFRRDIDKAIDALLRALRQAPDHRLTRRQIQRRMVGGARTPAELNTLLARFAEIYPGCVVEDKDPAQLGEHTITYVYLPGYEPKAA